MLNQTHSQRRLASTKGLFTIKNLKWQNIKTDRIVFQKQTPCRISIYVYGWRFKVPTTANIVKRKQDQSAQIRSFVLVSKYTAP